MNFYFVPCWFGGGRDLRTFTFWRGKRQWQGQRERSEQNRPIVQHLHQHRPPPVWNVLPCHLSLVNIHESSTSEYNCHDLWLALFSQSSHLANIYPHRQTVHSEKAQTECLIPNTAQCLASRDAQGLTESLCNHTPLRTCLCINKVQVRSNMLAILTSLVVFHHLYVTMSGWLV